jgi:hypothetical protein
MKSFPLLRLVYKKRESAPICEPDEAIWPLSRCGEILLSYAAILSLHILSSFPRLFALVEKTPQFQEIVHTKR